MSEPSGPDRIREAIARDRGHYAPAMPVRLCGDDATFGDAQTVREWEERRERMRMVDRRPSQLRRGGEWLAEMIQCPSCLGLRFGPAHLSRLLLIGRH